jgi:hypothetical protein
MILLFFSLILIFSQDDTSTTAFPLGFGYAPAVAGNSQATARPLAITPASTIGAPSGTRSLGTGTGLVIKPGVANFFSFTASAGPASIAGKVSNAYKAA